MYRAKLKQRKESRERARFLEKKIIYTSKIVEDKNLGNNAKKDSLKDLAA